MKPKICKGCGKEFTPFTSLQSTHQNIKCYKLWAKNKKQTVQQKLRKMSGRDEEALRHKADKEYQLAIIRLYPKSIISGEPTEVAHHWIYKVHSNATRYYIPNGIPITNEEHGTLHGKRPEALQNQIVIQRGTAWLEDLERERKKIVKLTSGYLEEALTKLEKNENTTKI